MIIEPVVGNMGCVPPRQGFLQAVRELTKRDGTLLIFDEVMTGFRVGPGGAQGRYGVTPDLPTLGKVIGRITSYNVCYTKLLRLSVAAES